MAYAGLIYKSINFIEDHLQEPIKVKDIADQIGCSLFHFIRIFNQTVGHSPYDYLMRRRLSESLTDLQVPQKRILDIALDYQFSSHEAFTRAFKKMFGGSPNQFRNLAQSFPKCMLPALSKDYLIFYETAGANLVPTLTHIKTSWLAGVSVDGDKVEKVIQFFSKNISADKKAKDLYAFLYHTIIGDETIEDGIMGYMINDDQLLNENQLLKKIPAGDYAVFAFDVGALDRQFFFQFLYHTWSPVSGLVLKNLLVLEKYNAVNNNHDYQLESLLVQIQGS